VRISPVVVVVVYRQITFTFPHFQDERAPCIAKTLRRTTFPCGRNIEEEAASKTSFLP
jgi:hypothetical protein